MVTIYMRFPIKKNGLEIQLEPGYGDHGTGEWLIYHDGYANQNARIALSNDIVFSKYGPNAKMAARLMFFC